MAAAYDIGAGFSSSNAFGATATANAGTNINFGSGAYMGDEYSGSYSATPTATSSASGKGPASAVTDANPNQRTNDLLGFDTSGTPIKIVIAAIITVAAIWTYNKYYA